MLEAPLRARRPKLAAPLSSGQARPVGRMPQAMKGQLEQIVSSAWSRILPAF